MESRTIRFLRRGELVSVGNVPPGRTLLELLREDLGATGTKEGCAEGDCGACTVAVSDGERCRAINSCIALAQSVDGKTLWTVEDIAAADGTLHPAQEAMVQCHGSQCGFCTPGFVMSLFALYQTGEPVTRARAQQALSGNLCRCTGYRPILDAAMSMRRHSRAGGNPGLPPAAQATPWIPASAGMTLNELLAARSAHPDAQLVAGCTDVGLWITKQHRQFDKLLDVTRCAELRRIERYPQHIAIGAAATLSDAFDALIAERPQLESFADRFAGLPIRNAGTMGGNIANGSPIGDSMPLLIALGAHIVLMSVRGHRELPLERFYTGYRKNLLAPDEVLAWIKVPRPRPGELLRAYKISKRWDDDISAVCLAIALELDAAGAVARVGIGAGGVAATPVRALQTEAVLRGRPWSEAAAQEAASTLRAEFQPISDMRASAAYRSEVLGNLVRRFWLESSGAPPVSLESFRLAELPA